MEERKPFIIFAFIVGITIAGLYIVDSLLGMSPQIYRIGEKQIYNVYYREEKIGSLSLQIENATTIEGVKSYVAAYKLKVPLLNQARAGRLKFDKNGNLRHAIIAEAREKALEWRVKLVYSYWHDLMWVMVEDNRDPENYREADGLISLSETVMMPEHVWYYLRTEELEEGYQTQFRLNLLPNPVIGPISLAQNLVANFQVTGAEKIETPSGTFNTWVIQGNNTRLAAWPVDKIWVSKKSGVVVKALENQKGKLVTYELVSRR